MEHDINLNIHYSAPEELWVKIDNIFSNMPYWDEKENCWRGDGIDLYASIEPSGIQIAGTMPENIWNEWYDTLKKELTEALGYDIGEPEDGFDFKYWKPFEKMYSDIKSIDNKFIVFNDNSMFDWEDFDTIERNISVEFPCFIFKSEYIELRIYFDGVSKRKNKQDFNNFNAKIKSLGLKHLKD
ncbi:MAG: hypothetical protein NC040_10320 [Muribaculaceae bacterium]|nr:hypothetical protein [Alistipes senegalensis]MCM1474445.1 hypothetical protein [Muribaculaceae bacterium]